ncbi:DNA-3-methyladenine glycosylase family protein, partial [Solicola sp. PLA-1-18]|uniref:DNA-3-methyladenine glycosylase family protein n=1 Tax=Solicola sp. PLA-1-18 TaxID=3380532 RepID=UPI003B7E1FA1
PRLTLVSRAHQRHPGVRVMRTGRVMESLIPAVLEQKVVGSDAFASWRRLLRRYGDDAPGPTPVPMKVPPTGETWRLVPSWEWHRAGVDPARARTAVTCASLERQLQGAVDLPPVEAEARLRAVPGVGVWTAAEVRQRALGDADAISIGDYHLAAAIGWTLLGRKIDDAEMVEVMEPWRPHRGRVVLLLSADGVLSKPRRGPRMARDNHSWH